MESVGKRDGRSPDHKALEDIRIQAVQRVEAGEAPSAVMRVMGFARTVINEWLNKYRAGGIEALRGVADSGTATQADGAAARLGVSHGDAEQPAAVAVRVRPLDAAMVRDLIRAELRRDPEPGLSWAALALAGAHAPAAGSPGD